MKELIQRHKIKIVATSPIFLLILLVWGAVKVISFGNPGIKTDDFFDNKNSLALRQFDNLDLKAKAYVVYDTNLKKIIYSKNAVAQLPLASLTKIMSAIVALDIAPKETIIDVNTDSKYNNNPNDRTVIVQGRWQLGDLLKLTLVSSSNSGINTISDELSSLQNFLGGERHFIELMNQKAKSLNLYQTYFLNESGLDINDSLAGAYGSSFDMAKMFDYALAKDPDIFGATKYNSIMINSTDGNFEKAQNTNSAVDQIHGLVASKTGFTELAQGNLIIAFDVDQKTRVIVVVLGSTLEGRFSDTEILTRATLAYYSLI